VDQIIFMSWFWFIGLRRIILFFLLLMQWSIRMPSKYLMASSWIVILLIIQVFIKNKIKNVTHLNNITHLKIYIKLCMLGFVIFFVLPCVLFLISFLVVLWADTFVICLYFCLYIYIASFSIPDVLCLIFNVWLWLKKSLTPTTSFIKYSMCIQ
jgi:hypothetical protein